MEEPKIVLDRKSFEALAADTRIRIMKSLLKRRKTLSEISEELGMSVSGVKEHLETLEGAELIRKMDDGHKWKYYELTGKGSGIVDPGKKGTRIMVLLSISMVAFLASAFMLALPALSQLAGYASIARAEPFSAEGDAMVAQAYEEPPSLGATDDGLEKGLQAEPAGVLGYGAEDQEPALGAADASGAMPLAEERNSQAEMAGAADDSADGGAEPDRNEFPLPLVVLVLSLGTMLVCVYELVKAPG